MLSAFFPGLFLGLSLITAIGAQNAFVLRQGLRGEHVLAVCLTCAISDAVLILVGVGGFAQASAWISGLETAARYAGAVFLFGYGLCRFRAAVGSNDTLSPADRMPAGLWATLTVSVVPCPRCGRFRIFGGSLISFWKGGDRWMGLVIGPVIRLVV